MNRMKTNALKFCVLPLGVLLGVYGCGGGGGGGGDTNPPPGPTSNLSILAGQTVSACTDSNGGKTSNVNAQTLIARGGQPLRNYNWSVASLSAFPSGTTVDPLTGVFKSTGGAFNLKKGSYGFDMTVSDGSSTVTESFTLVVSEANSSTVGGIPGVGCPTAVLQQDTSGSFSNLPAATAGTGYGAALFVMGGTPPYNSWAVASGSIPSGLVLDAASGILRSSAFSSASGQSFQFTVSVKDSTGAVASAGSAYKIKVN